MGRSIRAVVMAAVVGGSLVGAVPAAHAESTIVQDAIDAVRARVCTEEHGYGVVNCSETIDPLVDQAYEPVAPVVDTAWDKAVEAVGIAVDTAEWVRDEGPGYVEGRVRYVYCWMVEPENPDCQG